MHPKVTFDLQTIMYCISDTKSNFLIDVTGCNSMHSKLFVCYDAYFWHKAKKINNYKCKTNKHCVKSPTLIM